MAANAEDVVSFEQSRRKPGGKFYFPLTGLGEGRHTLYLPAPRAEVRRSLVDGKLVRRAVESCLDDPAILALRDATLKSAELGPFGVATFDSSFIEYVCVLIRKNYQLSDEDLEFLLFSGEDWQKGALDHLLGGGDIVNFISKLSSQPATAPEDTQEQVESTVASVDPLPQRASLWKRIGNFLGNL